MIALWSIFFSDFLGSKNSFFLIPQNLHFLSKISQVPKVPKNKFLLENLATGVWFFQNSNKKCQKCNSGIFVIPAAPENQSLNIQKCDVGAPQKSTSWKPKGDAIFADSFILSMIALWSDFFCVFAESQNLKKMALQKKRKKKHFSRAKENADFWPPLCFVDDCLMD